MKGRPARARAHPQARSGSPAAATRSRRRPGPPRAWLVLALALGLAGGAARAQTLRSDFFITNGQVNALALRGSTLYVGGIFTFVGPVTGGGVPVDTGTGVPASGFPVVNGSVLAAVADGSGGWFVGGQFTTVGNVARANLAHVLADHSVDPWNPGANNIVRTLLLRAGVLYVGGDFTTLAGVTRNRIGAVDAASAAATAWNPNANGSVRAFAPGASLLYVGGQFITIGGQSRNRIAALDYGTGNADATWNPNSNSNVLALSLDAGANLVYAGGQFTQIGGQTRNRLAAIDATSGLVSTWNPPDDPPVCLHGDVNFRNWVINDECIGLVDLDSLCVGPAAADLGSMLAGLRYHHRIGRFSGALEWQSAAALLAGYASVRRLPAARALRWHAAAALLTERALHAVTWMRPEALPYLDVLLADARAILGGDGDV